MAERRPMMPGQNDESAWPETTTSDDQLSRDFAAEPHAERKFRALTPLIWCSTRRA